MGCSRLLIHTVHRERPPGISSVDLFLCRYPSGQVLTFIKIHPMYF